MKTPTWAHVVGIGMFSIFGEIFGMLADVILLIVITASDKSAYQMDDLKNNNAQSS